MYTSVVRYVLLRSLYNLVSSKILTTLVQPVLHLSNTSITQTLVDRTLRRYPVMAPFDSTGFLQDIWILLLVVLCMTLVGTVDTIKNNDILMVYAVMVRWCNGVLVYDVIVYNVTEYGWKMKLNCLMAKCCSCNGVTVYGVKL